LAFAAIGLGAQGQINLKSEKADAGKQKTVIWVEFMGEK